MSEDTRNHLGHGNITKMITLFIIGFFILGPRECWGLGDANDAKWWETALFYDVSWPFNEHSYSYENLRALIEDIDNMKKLSVDALCLQPIFPWVIDPYSIASYTAVNEALGTIDDIAELIEMAHDNGIKVILDIVPFYTSDQHAWFQRWERNIGRYDGFYLSMMDIEPDLYWLWSTKRKMAYRRIYGKKSPMLNLDMDSVRRQLNEGIATFWLNIGVDGFRIIESSIYLLSSMNTDEELSLVESTKNYLKGMREHVDKWTTKRNSTSTYLAVEVTTKGRDWSLYNTMKDLSGVVPLNNVLISINSATPSGTNAMWLKELILRKLNAIPPGASIRWMLRHFGYSSLPLGVGAQNAAALAMLMMLLPGQARVLMADERSLNSWSTIKVDLSTVRHCYICPFANMTALMKLPVFRQGEHDLEALNDDAVLVLRRHMSDDPNVYAAVINLTDREEKISPSKLFPDLGERLEILFNTYTNATTIGSVPYHDSVSVPAHSGMVLMSARMTRKTNKDVENPKKESGGGEGGTTVPTVGKGEGAMPSQHGESGTTETNKDVGTPKKEGEGRTEKPKISGENDQGRGDEEDKSGGKGGEKPSKSGEDAAAKGKEDEQVHERVQDDPKGKGKEINKDEGRVGDEQTTGWGVLKRIGKFWRSIGQLCARDWRKVGNRLSPKDISMESSVNVYNNNNNNNNRIIGIVNHNK